VSRRALSQVFGPIPVGDAQLLRNDPFLLLPAFFAALPVPLSRLALDEGMLSVTDSGLTWVLLASRLQGSPYELEVQRRLGDAIDGATARLRAADPRVEVLRLGAAFFARQGAQTAMSETSRIGIASVVGMVALALLVFWSARPLLMILLSLGIGMACGFAASLLIFGELHVLSLLLGFSLIGVAVDYGVYYCTEAFAEPAGTPAERLARVLPATTMSMVATVAGYGMLLLAPLPGFRQLATIAVVGLVAAWATVVLWLPLLDRDRGLAGGRKLSLATAIWRLWERPRLRWLRLLLGAVLLAAAAAGATRFSIDDDVRRLQPLAPELVREQERIQQLIGAATGAQFFVVRADNDEAALQAQEMLFERLAKLGGEGALAGWRAPASFVPSAARQRANRALVARHLSGPAREAHLATLGLDDATPPPEGDGVLTLAEARRSTVLAELLADMLPAQARGATHVVMLDGVSRAAAVRAAAEGIAGMRFVDPAADFSDLLGRYRQRAVLLVGASAVAIAGLLVWWLGLSGAARALLPVAAACLLTPLLRALSGEPFTFFDAMALVLVLAIGVDYGIFCVSTTRGRRAVSLLGVAMAAAATLISFGMLALSQMAAVHAFGATMLLGVGLALLLAPAAAVRFAAAGPEPDEKLHSQAASSGSEAQGDAVRSGRQGVDIRP
jgi:predicted exporter